MKNFALGKFVPYSTWVHRLDARLKVFSTIVLMVCIFLINGTYAMTFLTMGICFLVISIILWSTKIRILDVLSSLKSMWFMVLFLLIIYIIIPMPNHVLPIAWNINGWVVYWDSFLTAGKIFLRLLLMIELTMILTASTKPLDLTYAIEWYLKPLKIFHFPSAEVAMTISIALRFIPTLLEDANRVMKAQSSRGVDFAHGGLGHKIKSLISLIIPLFVSSFMRSEELANAMECRGYDPKQKRSKYRQMHWHVIDSIFLLIVAILLACFITMAVTNFDFFAFIGVNAL